MGHTTKAGGGGVLAGAELQTARWRRVAPRRAAKNVGGKRREHSPAIGNSSNSKPRSHHMLVMKYGGTCSGGEAVVTAALTGGRSRLLADDSVRTGADRKRAHPHGSSLLETELQRRKVAVCDMPWLLCSNPKT